jgi:bifunctional ADP-heptose synthase (sugar kinase/adenylyltransferase)
VAIVKSHHALRNITAAGSQLHGWEAKSGPAANVMVNIALLGVEPGSVTVQGEIVECDSELT